MAAIGVKLMGIEQGVTKHWEGMRDATSHLDDMGYREEAKELDDFKPKNRKVIQGIMKYLSQDRANTMSASELSTRTGPHFDHGAVAQSQAGSAVGSIHNQAELATQAAAHSQTKLSDKNIARPPGQQDEKKKEKKKKKQKKQLKKKKKKKKKKNKNKFALSSSESSDSSSSSSSSSSESDSEEESETDSEISDPGSSVSHTSKQKVPTVTIATGLKPKEVTHNMTRVEQHDFKEAFGAYFYTSNMHTLSTNQQRAYFFRVINSVLKNYIRNCCTPYGNKGIPVYAKKPGRPSLMGFMDAYFESVNPVHIRRAELSQMKKNKYEKNSQFVARYLQLAEDAELAKTPIDNYIATQAVAGCDESAIRTSLLLDAKLTTKGLVAKIEAYEAAGRKKSQKDFNSATGLSATGKNNAPGATSDNQCHKCVIPGHKPENCYWNTHKCLFCHIKGHDINVCNKRKEAQGQKASSSNPASQTQGKGKQFGKKKGAANAAEIEENDSEEHASVSTASASASIRDVVM